MAACLPNDAGIVVASTARCGSGPSGSGVNRALAPGREIRHARGVDAGQFLADPETAATHQAAVRALPVDPAGRHGEWAMALAASAGAARRPPPDADAPAAIAFTSGTTGLRKGIVYSQRNLLLPAVSLAASRRYDETLRNGDCLPLTILNLQLLTTLLTFAPSRGTHLRRGGLPDTELQRMDTNIWS